MRNCGCCKFKELSPAEFPCCDCGASNHWEAEEEAKKMRLEKDCDHCKHSDVASYEEPCVNCDGDNYYEEKVIKPEKRCSTCKYNRKSAYVEPCDSCSAKAENWEAKAEEIETPKCGNCKYSEQKGNLEPCTSCIVGEKWEAPEIPEPECKDCKFEDTAVSDFPCNVCDEGDEWQEKVFSQRQGDCEYCKYKGLNGDATPCINCCNPVDNWVDIDQPELAEDPEPEPLDISEMKVVNLDDGFSVLYGYGGMKILQQGTVLTDIYNPAIRAVLYKLIKKLEEEK